MEKKITKNLLIGAHTSAQGGAHNALTEGASIGATTIQLFTANQKTWHGKGISDEAIALWNESLQETGIEKVMSHASYLINLGSPDPEKLLKSRKAFAEEIQRSISLNLSFINFHPGAALHSTKDQCLATIVESLLEIEKLLEGRGLLLLLESTAGQGTTVGDRLEDLGYLVHEVRKKIPIGVCLDTCHLFAAGFDISHQEGLEKMLKDFDQTVGLHYLYALHINDSMNSLGSKVDRHAPLGKGKMGLECFKMIMNHPVLEKLPKYLETPLGPSCWKEEIAVLRGFVH
jgi:deoxyribonuclease IV